MTIMKKIDNIKDKPSKNIILIIVFTVLSWVIGMLALSNLPASSGHGGFLNLTYSWFIGISTIILYLLSRIFTKKYNWVISLIGIVYNLYEAICFWL